jgi:hypothetical protein
MHGSISLTSTPGAGSTATFSAPFKIASCGRDPQLASPSPPTLGIRIPSPGIASPLKTVGDSDKVSRPSPDRTMTSELLNQQISSSVTNYNSPVKMSKKGSLDIGAKTGDLSPEQRKNVHVLVVEDKYAIPISSYYF